jgi:hypothetical protein
MAGDINAAAGECFFQRDFKCSGLWPALDQIESMENPDASDPALVRLARLSREEEPSFVAHGPSLIFDKSSLEKPHPRMRKQRRRICTFPSYTHFALPMASVYNTGDLAIRPVSYITARKYPEMSRMRCVGFDAKALIDPVNVSTIAMFEVTVPSMAFNVETSG